MQYMHSHKQKKKLRSKQDVYLKVNSATTAVFCCSVAICYTIYSYDDLSSVLFHRDHLCLQLLYFSFLSKINLKTVLFALCVYFFFWWSFTDSHSFSFTVCITQVYEHHDGSKSLKLGDFGLATVVNGPLYTVCGTPTYVAPEIVAETGWVRGVASPETW